jgi:RND superfamily putative drug exporter
MATSLTLLPAMLGFLGPKVLSRRERAALAATGRWLAGQGFWLSWAKVVEARKCWSPIAALAIMVLIAFPITQLRLGPLTRAPTRRARPPTRPTPPWPEGSAPGSTDRCNWSASCPPGRPARFDRVIDAAPTPRVASVTPP